MSDPSHSSEYLDRALYDSLVGWFTDWQREDRIVADPRVRDAATALLLREARLIDDRRFEEWLALFVPECIYWVPGSPGGDPRKEVAICFDDRRMLEGRIHRLRSGSAWSQVPASRTTHIVGNVEVFATDAPTEWMVRSNLVLAEMRAGESRVIAGWCAHRLAATESGWRIRVKQVNLIECDRNLLNPSLIF